MDSILDLIPQLMNSGATSQLSQQIGADEQTTQQGLAAAVPVLLAALSRNASNPGGAEELYGALSRDHDGSLLDNPATALGSGAAMQDGFGILQHVLGGQQGQVAQTLSRQTGLDPATAGQLLAAAAPLVLAWLGRSQRQQGLDPGGLQGYLGGQYQQAEAATPGLMGVAEQFLDSNRDGSMVDDITRLAGQFFGRR